MFNVRRLAKFLATGVMPEMTALDESLAEHDKKYHPDGYKDGDSCNKRAEMAKNDDEKIPDRERENNQDISDERKNEVFELIGSYVRTTGSALSDSGYLEKPHIDDFKWEGDKFVARASGLQFYGNMKEEFLEKRFKSDELTPAQDDFLRKRFELKDVEFNVEKYDSGKRELIDFPETGSRKGDPIYQYRVTISGRVKDIAKEVEDNIKETTDKVFDMARKAVGDSGRFEVKRMVGKRNFESGKPYEAVGIYDKKRGISEVTYRVGGKYGKSVTSRHAGCGESDIDIESVEADVRNYIR